MKIAISGKRNSGKDTVANILAEEIGKSVTYRTAFANPVKYIAKILFPNISDDILYGPSSLRDSTVVPDLSDNLISIRKLLQDIGKFGRNYNPDIWVNITLHTCNSNLFKSVIISDCRFINEFLKLKHNNYTIIRVKRNNTNTNTSEADSDISETDLDIYNDDSYDYVINNDSDIDSLRDKVRVMLSHISVVE